MIRNIIFDLGNVLISWKPEDYLRLNGYSDSARNQILDHVIRSPEWLLLDNGDIDLSEAAERIAAKSSLKIPEIFAVFDLRTSILFPLVSNAKLLPALKEYGFKLYYLSNFPDDIFDEIQNRYELFRFFDGGIISARVKISKPDPEIFRVLMKMYRLIPEESLFIDDIAVNSLAAESVGITGIHLHDPDLLKEMLQHKLGVVINI
jgi:glucose-1-phosphatase